LTPPAALPVGDEAWYDADTGGVTELAPFDVKALDDETKRQYLAQLHYQQACQVGEIGRVLGKLLRVWTPDPAGGALKTGPVAGAGTGTGGGGGSAAAALLDGSAAATPATHSTALTATRKAHADDEEASVDDRDLGAILAAPSPELQAILDGHASLLGAPTHPDGLTAAAEGATEGEGSVLYYGEYVTRTWAAVTHSFPKAADVKATLDALAAHHAAQQAENADTHPNTARGEGRRMMSRRNSTAGRAHAAIAAAQASVALTSALPPYGLFDILLDGDESEKVVATNALAVLPPPKISLAELAMMIPPSQEYQITRRPYPRMARRPVGNFALVGVDDESVEKGRGMFALAGLPVEEVKVVKGKGKGKEAKVDPKSVVVVPVDPNAPPTYYDDSETKFVARWVIEPYSTVQFKVRFRSLAEGQYDSSLAFEVVGTNQTVTLFCQGHCEVPRISADPRSIFMRRVKAMPLPPCPPRSDGSARPKTCIPSAPCSCSRRLPGGTSSRVRRPPRSL
jgi:hypothetical protein